MGIPSAAGSLLLPLFDPVSDNSSSQSIDKESRLKTMHSIKEMS